MPNTVDFTGKPFHFIGIGGIGMSALAYVLAKRQIPVSGSDLRSTHITQRLQAVGAHLFGNQDASNLEFFRSRTEQAYGEVPTGISVSPTFGIASGVANTQTVGTTQLSSGLPQVICSTAINTVNSEYQ